MKRLIGALLLLSLVTLGSIWLSLFSHPVVKRIEVAVGTTNDAAAAYQQQFKIIFSRPMNHQSVEQSFSITPPVAGNFSWVQNTLFFTPKSTLDYGQTYTLNIKQGTDMYGRSLPRAFTGKISTHPYQYLYLTNDHNLMLGTLNGDQVALTSGQQVTFYEYSRDAHTLVYLTEPDTPDADEAYLVTDLRHPQPQRILSEYKSIQNLAISPDGEHIYFLAAIPDRTVVDEQLGVKITTNQGLFDYSTTDQTVHEVVLPDALSAFLQYWILPDGQTFLISNSGAYYLKSITDDTSLVLGSFGDYGGADLTSSKFVFTKNYVADFSNAIILNDGQSRSVNQGGDIGAVPSIDDTGSLVSYSFKSRQGGYEVRVIKTDSGDILLTTTEHGNSYLQSEFSPDSRYLAVAVPQDTGDENASSGDGFAVKSQRNYLNGNLVTVLYDLSTGKKIDLKVNGYNLQWIH